ncbi:MAG: nucleotide sugar dehydrogenase [Betaproteobacteria bacterium]|nr:nucleotide sugar dehydrogenase [Betaproteobacteria bacterium]
MNISIFGLGYVGAVSLACLARDGHHVIGVDIEPAKLALIREGKTPVVEEGMVDLMQAVAASGRVKVTTDLREAVLESEISLICVGTPSAANGSQDQSAVLRLSAAIGQVVREKVTPHVFVFRSTLAPGTVEDVIRPIVERESGKKDGEGFHLCFQPEFLREGSSIRDYDQPPFTVVGANHSYPIERLHALFGHLKCEFVTTSVRSAEMVKLCCNNFHTLKITFANETARLCSALKVDPFEVMDLLCRDKQLNISKAYLNPGYAFGGSCLPKDLRATMYLAKTHDVELPMLGALLPSNRLHLELALDKVLATGKRRIGFIGLSFKTGTDDLRESPMVALAEQLIGKGLSLLVYDPEVHLSRLIGANKRYIEQHVPHLGSLIRRDLAEVMESSDVLIVGLNDEATISSFVRLVRPEQVIIDLVGMPSEVHIQSQIHGLCW